MTKIVDPPMENDLTIIVELDGIKFTANKDSIQIHSQDMNTEKKCIIETSFDELQEVVDIVGASVLVGEDDDEDDD